MLWLERGDDKLKTILVTSSHAMFILFAVIYSFSIVAQVFLEFNTSSQCNSNSDYIDILFFVLCLHLFLCNVI